MLAFRRAGEYNYPPSNPIIHKKNMTSNSAAKMTDTTKTFYPNAEPNPDFAKLEEKTLAYWQADGVFEKSVNERPATIGGANNEYIFYDGPPFANGLPHYGHLLTGFVKDMMARYHTMKGKRVERRFGWDCHGLPAEMGAEKDLKISGRQQISDFGIEKFNAHCRTSVMRYAGEWEHYVTRQARWVDFSGDYKTMDKNYMESVLWAFKQLHEKGLIFESHRVMPYSWAAETPLSNFETKLDNAYRERTDKAITVAFELNEKPAGAPEADKYFVLAWTTTPWTLPSNLALAAHKEMSYTSIMKDGMCYILSTVQRNNFFGDKAFADFIFGKDEGQMHTETSFFQFTGKNLIGLTYKPLFPYFANHPEAFRILDGSSFIEEGSGTGIVHMAPGFGEDDQRVCKENGIDVVVPVNESGRYTDEIFDIAEPAPLTLKGLNVIAQTEGTCDAEPYTDDQLGKYGLVNLRIINWLKMTGSLIKQEDYKHNYPHCWRTDTPLIYRALPSWYVKVTAIRDRAVELNQQINWIPEHIKDGQMGHMLATAPDWSISRNRFWGTPIPVWRSDNPKNDKLYVFGSIAELEEFFGTKVEDLHRPFIDELTKPDPEDSNYTLRRVTDVFDCWFESGSMPFAQVHYPFENKEWFETHFPADFITEYVGQTRGWFNTLIILATALFDKPPFKNCICHGVVLDAETGLKYSKRLKNYKDPLEVIDKFGADALRWLMISSPVMRGQDLMVDPEGKFIRDAVRLHIKPLWNAYNFFTLYANADGVQAQEISTADALLDQYILAKLKSAVSAVETAMDAYDTINACKAVGEFFDVLNNWYIRRTRERFWAGTEQGISADKQAAYNTLYTALVHMSRAAAPLLPLVTEEIYRGLTGKESVHLATFPDVSAIAANDALVADMDRVQDICNVALSIRNEVNIRVRQPLSKVDIFVNETNIADRWAKLYGREIAKIIESEINVKEVGEGNKDLADVADLKLKLNNQILGKRLPEKMKQIIPASKQGKWEMKDGKLIVCEEVLLPEEYELTLEPKAGLKGAAPLSTNDALVVLDLNITDELKAEGYARDVVRMVQQARKDADFNVSDSIALTLDVPAELQPQLAGFEGFIKEQTLANTLTFGAPAAGAFSATNPLEEWQVIVGVAKQ